MKLVYITEKSEIQELKNSSNGITLIALVVTIIVLLILAGVVIAMLTGQNGIITQARTAKNMNRKAELIERAKLDISAIQIDHQAQRKDADLSNSELAGVLTNYFYDSVGNAITVRTKLTPNTVVTDKEDKAITTTVAEIYNGKIAADSIKWYTDKNGDMAPCPSGFKISTKDGENEVKKGLVIEDSNQNQYVWIPVDGTNLKYERTEWSVEDDGGTLASRDELTLNNATFTATDLQYGINENVTKEIMDQVKAEKESVAKYGGYYMGRYETGIESSTNTTPQIKAGLEPYTRGTYGQTVTRQDAYNKANSINNSQDARTYLCSSYAWDTAINCIMKYTSYTNYATNRDNMNENWKDKEVRDSSGHVIKKAGEAVRLKTGKTTPKFNIYDMGGNVAEFTTEINPGTSESSVLRGNSYLYSNVPAGARWDATIGYSSFNDGGFRATLILK